jgi:nitrite reductase/ring-hydroxylating ferredoxin subunit
MHYDCITCGSELELEETVEFRFARKLDSRTGNHYETLGEVRDITSGQHKVFAFGNREIVVFAVDGEYYAMKNLCPHHGVALAGGTLDNGTVRCPGHGFRFNLKTGECEKDPTLRASVLDLKVEDGKLKVRTG